MEIGINTVYIVGFIVVIGLILGVVSNRVNFGSGWFKFNVDNTTRDNSAKVKGKQNKISQGKQGKSSKNIADVDGEENEITQG